MALRDAEMRISSGRVSGGWMLCTDGVSDNEVEESCQAVTRTK